MTMQVDSPTETVKTIPVPGGDLFVKQWIPERTISTAPIILFHDSIGCVEMWRQFPQSLAIRLQRRVIAYDRLGFGRSSLRRGLPSVQFVTEEAERIFPVIHETLDLDRFVALGHSVGGAMAVMVAARFAERCVAVITESAQAFVEDRTLQAIAEAKVKFSDPRELAKLERYHGTKARWVVDAWTDNWLTPQFRDWNLLADLPRVRCPLLAIHGDSDEYGSIAFPQILSGKTSGPTEMFVVTGCGHVPHRERETEVLEKIGAFLREH